LPDGTIRVGLWQNGKRISWLESENDEENQRGREYGNYYDDYSLTPNQNNTQATNLTTSPIKQSGYSQFSGDKFEGHILKEQKDIY